MAATKKQAAQPTKKQPRSRLLYIPEDDRRSIVDIVAPGGVDPRTGELVEKARFILAGPKGGTFSISLPMHIWQRWNGVAEVGDLFSGGWKYRLDADGNVLFGDDGKPLTQFVDDQVWAD